MSGLLACIWWRHDLRKRIDPRSVGAFWPDFFIEDAVAFDIETFINDGIFGGMKMRTGKVFACTMTALGPRY